MRATATSGQVRVPVNAERVNAVVRASNTRVSLASEEGSLGNPALLPRRSRRGQGTAMRFTLALG